MIVHNDFREFQHVAEEVDQRLYFTNLIIKRGDKNETPRNEHVRLDTPFMIQLLLRIGLHMYIRLRRL